MKGFALQSSRLCLLTQPPLQPQMTSALGSWTEVCSPLSTKEEGVATEKTGVSWLHDKIHHLELAHCCLKQKWGFLSTGDTE